MCQFWKDSVKAISQGFEISKTKATLIMLVMITIMLVILVQTWFIWAILIGTVLVVLILLLITEWSLRLYYWIHDWRQSPGLTYRQVSDMKPKIPDTLASPCSDIQGRITKRELDTQDTFSMAEQILQYATVRKVSAPGWLRFPAICRAFPSLSHAARVLMAIIES